MTILISLALASVLFFVLIKTYSGYGDWDTLYAIALVLSALGFAIGCVTVPLNRMGVRDTLAQVEATRNTKPANEAQDTAWRMRAADANAEIAGLKYWNGTAFDIWIPDDVDSVKPL